MIAFLLVTMLAAQNPGDVVISEIMYNPDGNTLGLDEHLEWIEIYNNSVEGINLAGMMLSDGNNQVFLGHYLLAPDTYGVIPANDLSFTAAYGSDIRLIPWSGEWTRLRNS
ncbi:MAG: lamin tail domain-containing protein, partial [bacterium]|nr:lamin tail domain-containing protein [bacterium]